MKTLCKTKYISVIESFISFTNRKITTFIPKHKPPNDDDILRMQEFLLWHNKIVVVTGAGISTESGIPDYRSEGVGLYARSNSRPMKIQDFIKSEDSRKRYWARNYVGWPRFSAFQPSATHYAVRDLELKHNKVTCVVTQNVDRLHSKAGSKKVIEIHGSSYEVMCLSCDFRIDRQDFQEILTSLNPTMTETSDCIRPDGDVDLSEEQYQSFKVPPCMKCGTGALKPDIVFFGDNVPKLRVEKIRQQVNNSDSLLVLGTSLTVFSGYRIILQAVELKRPIVIVNIGETRADPHATIKIDSMCGDILPSALKFDVLENGKSS